MCKCPTIHEIPEFKEANNPQDREQKNEYEKIKRFLSSESGHHFGENLKHKLFPFKSYPRGHKSTRILFILCKDCKGEVLDPKKCQFCKMPFHSMNDAVLFMIGNHSKSYEKEGLEIVKEYKKKI